jgi:hypothetical protein
MAIRFKLQVEGLQELRQLLRGDELLREPYKDAMNTIADTARAGVRAAAPVGLTGRTREAVRAIVSAARIPLWVRVEDKVLVRTKQGRAVNYPRLLEFSPFAQNRYRKGASRHKGWKKDAITRLEGRINAIFQAARVDVENRWRR